MRIDIIAAVPELLDSSLNHSMMKRAQDKGLLEVHSHDLRKFGIGNYRQIDDYPYGGGAGMVMKVEPIFACIEQLQTQRDYDEVIYLTPDGETLKQGVVNYLSLQQNLIILCGHYKGVDQRVRDRLITREISIGDYVLSGGELAAAVLTDAIGRLLPGVLNDECSALEDSFQDNLLAPPVYTRPAKYRGMEVPGVLLSGHDARIREWRESKALEITSERRPDLLEND